MQMGSPPAGDTTGPAELQSRSHVEGSVKSSSKEFCITLLFNLEFLKHAWSQILWPRTKFFQWSITGQRAQPGPPPTRCTCASLHVRNSRGEQSSVCALGQTRDGAARLGKVTRPTGPSSDLTDQGLKVHIC